MDIPLDKEFLQSFNVTALREFVDWEQLKKISETNNLQPDSTLALASFIGMMMMAQQYAMRKKTPRPAAPPSPHMGAVEGLQERLDQRRKRRRRRKRKRVKTQNIPQTDQDPFTKNYWVKNVDFDYNYPDFYDEKNYEYIDDVDVEKIKLNIQSNRKISDDGEELKFNFKPLDYDSYEFEDVGILNFNKPPTKTVSQKTISKRRFRPARARRPLVPAVVRRQKPSQFSYGLVKIKPRVGTSPFLQNMGSVFDFPSMLAVAGFWFVWQNYLVNLVPTTVLSDFVSSLGLGRSAQGENQQQILEALETFLSRQEMLLSGNKEARD